ncbi:hypothetical protein GRI89_07695 [Altererythrobacter salegens]|uniref:Uncharacterized protein n=1 Tax=Croceibacterium salegens TaxID=1737568 RepID=A0A6I4SYS5_9SPHN|nr:hypothetical protein [Croceibacterium salegens]MXO59422.1 hypothetical protein [Croceibacterium salegens]
MRCSLVPIVLILALAACDRPEAPVGGQRISLDDARGTVEEPLASPDTKDAKWTVAKNGQSIDFGIEGGKPFMSLSCKLKDAPPTIHIIRHVTTRPGEKALFPVIGNGMISRFKVDATLADGEWRWEGAVPAEDGSLEVFTGRRELEATLPGAGSLMIEGSAIPGEFIDWCRKGGAVAKAVEKEEDKAVEEMKAE